jgi:hypothetical protein
LIDSMQNRTIALPTDSGLQDAFVVILKGVTLSITMYRQGSGFDYFLLESWLDMLRQL